MISPRNREHLAARSISDTEVEDDEDDKKEKPKKPVTLRSIMIRTVTASLLALFFLGLLQTGHFYCIFLARILNLFILFILTFWF